MPEAPSPQPDDAEARRRRTERDLRRYGPRRGPGTWIWWAIAIGGLLLFAVLMRAVMEKTRWTDGALAEPTSSVPTARPGLA